MRLAHLGIVVCLALAAPAAWGEDPAGENDGPRPDGSIHGTRTVSTSEFFVGGKLGVALTSPALFSWGGTVGWRLVDIMSIGAYYLGSVFDAEVAQVARASLNEGEGDISAFGLAPKLHFMGLHVGPLIGLLTASALEGKAPAVVKTYRSYWIGPGVAAGFDYRLENSPVSLGVEASQIHGLVFTNYLVLTSIFAVVKYRFGL